jgi:imidazole glycerol-phosphate synthase subunit HisH
VTRAAVLDYDLGNLPSVTKALERIGVDAEIVTSPDGLANGFDALVVPGVGHFGTGARNLRDRGFDTSIKDWASSGKPLLGICVGLQLFLEGSEEDPDEPGLGIIPGRVRRLRAGKVPHMGWNTVDVSSDARVLPAIRPGEMAYFVHSFYVDPEPSSVAATTTYEETFCSGVERDNVVGVQFHPEKSADVGRRVLERFFEVIAR